MSTPPSALESDIRPDERYPFSLGKGGFARLIFPFAIVSAAFALYLGLHYLGYFSSLLATIHPMPLLAVASLVIILGMSGLYYYAYTFYGDIFYAYLAVGWIGNAVYILFEGFYAPPVTDIWFSLSVYVFAQLSFVPLYFASFIKPNEKLNYKGMFFGLGKWFAWIFISLIVALRWIPLYKPNLDPETAFVIATIGGVPFAMISLWRVGRALSSRLNYDVHRGFTKIFPATFFVWAAVQPLYIFKLFAKGHVVIIAAFLVALLTKILNSIFAIVTIHLDFGILREKLQSKTIFEDLGVLTASIEHDIRNPLMVIATEIDGMRDKFQANKDVVHRLGKMEDQIARISATTEIIETLRGGAEYYGKFMTKTGIGDLMHRSVRAVKGEMQPSNIIIKLETRPLYTRAYQPLLQQVFVNILKNSVEAIREGSRDTGLITIEMHDDKKTAGMLVVKVWDNGVGIKEEDLPKLGKLYSSKRDRKANSGIGLFISKRILAFHNGRLDIKSDKDAGTTVSIFLPKWREQG